MGGATIPMKLLPIPSMNLLVNIIPAVALKAPMAAPITRANMAISPVIL